MANDSADEYGPRLRFVAIASIISFIFAIFFGIQWQFTNSLIYVVLFLISLVSIIIAPIKTFNSIKYNLEAVKWALRASNYYSFKDSMPLEVIVRRFVSLEKY